ncbi:MAG: hypothetical protein JXR96_04730 [Deltaproteobacteria bacterium]|nr:hypothetical protein [Deltaproteobacteria bacterium]
MTRRSKARWLWYPVPALALLLGCLVWARLIYEALTNVSPPHPIRVQGVAPADEAPWFRCHFKDHVQDGCGIWAAWQCGLGDEGHGELVRIDLGSLEVQRRWPLPAPWTDPRSLEIRGLMASGEDRLVLVSVSRDRRTRDEIVLRIRPQGGASLVGSLAGAPESVYQLLAWDARGPGLEFVYYRGQVCRIPSPSDPSPPNPLSRRERGDLLRREAGRAREGEGPLRCTQLAPDLDRRPLLLGAWLGPDGAWRAVWQKKYNWDRPHELMLLGPEGRQPIEGVPRKLRGLDRLPGHVLRSDGLWRVEGSRLVHPPKPDLPAGAGSEFYPAGLLRLEGQELVRTAVWRKGAHHHIARLGDRFARMDTGWDLRLGARLDRPGPLVAHDDLSATIATYPVEYRGRSWIIHETSLGAVVLDEELRPVPLSFGQRYRRLLPSSRGEQERMMHGVGPNIMTFWPGDRGAQVLAQFMPIALLPGWFLLLLLCLPFVRRLGGRIVLVVLSSSYLLACLLWGHDYWLITSWF